MGFDLKLYRYRDRFLLVPPCSYRPSSSPYAGTSPHRHAIEDAGVRLETLQLAMLVTSRRVSHLRGTWDI